MNKDTFCVYPFFHISAERNGAYTCCGASVKYSEKNVYTDDIPSVWNDEYFRQLRLDSVNGVKNSNCQTCWYHESNGIESRRQRVNAAYQQEFNLTAEDVNKTHGHVEDLPTQISIRVENICNLKCIVCNHYHSSQHEKEINGFKEQGIKLPKWIQWVDDQNKLRINPTISKKNTVANNLKQVLINSSKLEIEGGEPLLASMTKEIFDYCVENNLTDLEVELVSNLTSITEEMLDVMMKFSNLKIWASWDHLDPEKSRFIRYPADYNSFLSIFHRLSQHKNIKLGISFAVSIFNIFEVPEILDHFEDLSQQGLLQACVVFKPVMMPDYFSVGYLEQEQRNLAKDIIKNFKIKSKDYKIMLDKDLIVALDNMYSMLDRPPENFLEVVKERTRMLDLYDSTRNTNYKSLFPYIKQYY